MILSTQMLSATNATATMCPHCAGRLVLVPAESDEMRVMRTDGTSALADSPQPTQQHLTEAAPAESGWTLREWWERVTRPEMEFRGKTKGRIGDIERAVSRWDSCWSEYRSTNPVLRDISPITLGQYRTWLVSELGVSVRVANNHISDVQQLLGDAKRAWVIPREIQLQPLKVRPGETEKRKLKFTFSHDELDRMYAAAASASWPASFADGKRCLNAADYWQAFIVAAFNFGFRPGDWWPYDGGHALYWGSVHWEPDIELDGVVESHRHGWITWQPPKTADSSGIRLTLPMPEVVRTHLRRLWNALPKRRREADRPVFDFAQSAGTRKTAESAATGWYSTYWSIVAGAGCQPKSAKQTRIVGGQKRTYIENTTHCPSHFRKTAETEIRDMVIIFDGQAIRVGDGADAILGHAADTIGKKHYYREMRFVREVITARVQPPQFLRLSN